MKPAIPLKYLILITTTLVSSKAAVQAPDLFDFNLEELLNIRINIASKENNQ